MSLFGEEVYEEINLKEAASLVLKRDASEKDVDFFQKQIDEHEKLDNKKYNVKLSEKNLHIGIYDRETGAYKCWLKQP